MSQDSEVRMPIASAPPVTTCSNCHSAMPSELRFCRNCGFRLGEGAAEYIETVRFDSTRGRMAPGSASVVSAPKKRRRMSGMAWVFIALLVFFIGAAAFTAVIAPRQSSRIVGVPVPARAKSYLGVNGFDSVENGAGVTFDSVTAPDSPADKAGLVGGDIITSFDGQQIHDEDQISELMVGTPVGKTVEVEYLRDGEKKTTKLTTISVDDNRRLTTLFEKRPEGRGQFGYEDGDAERVEVPGTNLHGVKLNTLLQSRPADLAGVKEGDIVVEFDKVPIRTDEEFLMRVRRALPYTTVNLVIYREEAGKFVKMEIPVKMGKQ